MQSKDKLSQLAARELDAVINKVDQNISRFTNATPHLSDSLLFSDQLSQDGSWTAGFWFGMVCLAAIAQKNVGRYADYLNAFKPFFTRRIRTGHKDHDLGFLYQLYAVDAYRLTNDLDYLELADTAARCLFARFNPRGGYIRAWGALAMEERDGTLIADCMMNLPLLFSVSNAGGDPRFHEAAERHAEATLHAIRADGSIYHTFTFDPVTGAPIGGGNEGGYADESCWSRGIAWVIYGYYMAWAHTGRSDFLEACLKTSAYFMQNTDPEQLPLWDFRCDDAADNIIDTSAAAIVCCAFYRMTESLHNPRYGEFADRMLYALIQKHSHAADPNAEALLDSGLCRRYVHEKRISVHCATIWGDYFFMEALMLRSGHKVRMWEM